MKNYYPKVLFVSVLVMVFSNFLNTSFGQGYNLQKIGDVPPADQMANSIFYSGSNAIAYATFPNQITFNNSYKVYIFNGVNWTLHSELNNSSLLVRTVFKTPDNNYWALARVIDKGGPIKDTSYLLQFKNNSWQRIKKLQIFNGTNFDYSTLTTYKFNSNLHYFFNQDTCYYYSNNSWTSISLKSIKNENYLMDVLMKSPTDIKVIKSSNASVPNFNRTAYLYEFLNNNWLLKDSIMDAADPAVVNVTYNFSKNAYVNTTDFIIKYEIRVNPSFAYKHFLYSAENGKIKFINLLLPTSPRTANASTNENGDLYFISNDYVFQNDTIDIYLFRNNVLSKLKTITGQLNVQNLIYPMGNDIYMSASSTQPPFKNELYKLIEVKPVTSNFSYTIQGLVVSFHKTDTSCKNFIWDFGNGNTSSINPNPVVTYATAGTYSPCLKCDNVDLVCTIITVPCNNCSGSTVGLNSEPLQEVNVYPNPANTTLSVHGDFINAQYKITNIQGQLVQEGILGTIIDVEALANGLYYLQISDKSVRRFVKFIKLTN